MGAIITLENTLALTVEQNGGYTANPDGSYDVILGALQAVNSVGEVYISDAEVLQLFEASSNLQSRIADGSAKGEADHPNLNGLSEEKALERYLSVDPKLTSHIINKVSVDKKSVRVAGQPQPVYLIRGNITPMGAYGDALKSDLENPNSNTSFSIRAFCKRIVTPVSVIKKLTSIITWDWVDRPGINVANKKHTVTLETLDVLSFEVEDIKTMIEHIKENDKFATESDRAIAMMVENDILKCEGKCPLGW